MSVEVRACFEIGDTDGETMVRVLLQETVLRPTVSQTTAADLAALTAATLDRLGAEALERAGEQAEVFLRAMESVSGAPMVVQVADDLAGMTTEMRAFVDTLPGDVASSEHLPDVINAAADQGMALGNVTREVIINEVRRRESE